MASTDSKWGFGYSLVGNQGVAGTPGATIRSGSGAPADTLGRDGDYYFRTDTASFIGPRANGAYPTDGGISLVGPQGVGGTNGLDGATINAGTGLPDNTVGKQGDFWFSKDTGLIYGPRSAGTSGQYPTPGTSLLGPQGPKGDTGEAGLMGADGKTLRSGMSDPTDDTGDDGDYYFNASSGYFYGPKANGKWPTQGVLLKGPQGDVGPKGDSVTGPRGPGFLYGSGAPDNSIGEAGEFYIDSAAYRLYGPKDASQGWTNASISLVGPKGDQGPTSTTPGPQGAPGNTTRVGSSNPQATDGNDGDLFLNTSTGNLFGPKSGGVWPSSYTSLLGPKGDTGAASTVPGPQGVPGSSIRTGQGAPSNSVGNDGDIYYDTANSVLYSPRSGGVWPTPGTSLLGPQGIQGKPGAPGSILRYGSGAPSSSTVSNDGDFFIDQTNSRLYGPRASGTWPTSFVTLVGPTGASGSYIRTGQGAPDPSVGVIGDVYLDLAAGNLYGNKTSSGWPNSFTPLIGPMGQQGAQGQQGVAGVAGSQIYFGTDNPGLTTGNVGDYYYQTNTQSFLVKITSNSTNTTAAYPNGWQNLGSVTGATGAKGADSTVPGPKGDTGAASTVPGPQGLSLRNGTGAPTTSPANPSVQQDGDFYLDTAAQVLYGPRANGAWPATGVSTSGTIIRASNGYPAANLGNNGDYAIDTTQGFLYGPKTIANGWSGTSPISIVGPTGPSGQIQPMFGQFSAGYGAASYYVGSLNNTGQYGTPTGGISVQNYFVPVTNSAYMGAQVVNFGSSPSSCLWQLYNNTTGAAVFTGPSVAVGTVTTYGIQTTTAYPLVAGQSYSWRIYGSGSGFSSYIVPIYLYQCGAAQGISMYAPFVVNNLALSGTAQNMQPSGVAGQTMYYRSPSAGYLYSMQVTATGTASAAVTFAGYTTSAVTAANSPQVFGPFVAASNALAANTNYTATVTGSGTGSVFMVPSIVQ